MTGERFQPRGRFFVIGAAKSGTTILHHWLSRHPDLTLSLEKEARFLAYLGHMPAYKGYGACGQELMRENRTRLPVSFEDYEALFQAERPATLFGETSPVYLYEPSATANIQKYYPGSKCIAVLRNPIERAYSAYLHMKRENAEPLGFPEALDAEVNRIRENAGMPWRYQDMGLYAKQLKTCFKNIPRSHCNVFLYDDLVTAPEKVMCEICDFLEIPSAEACITTEKRNVSGIPKNVQLYKALRAEKGVSRMVKKVIPQGLRHTLRQKTNHLLLKRPDMDIETRERLTEFFREGLLELENLLERDLTIWR